ncbi:MAG: hypothetical protein M3Q64_00540 [bacterium]|nr:hypothetical protein [bacterium]
MKKQISILISIVFIFSALLNVNIASAQEAVLPGFNPDKLIDDAVFSDTKTFGDPEGIQKFLESKNSVLANKSPEFLAKLNEPTSKSLKEAVEDPRPSLNQLRTAAEIIWDASQSSGLNPQVILVKLNKEQSLITGRQTATPEQLQRALNFSMGFGCPDTQPCGEIYKGFYAQLFGNLDSEGNRYLGAAKSLMKSFSTPGGRGPFYNGATSKVGDTITLDNTLGGYEGVQARQTLTLSNAATAALYRYTPHVFNGNYNFWKFFNSWFRYPNGTILKLSGETDVHIIQNGTRFKLLPFVAQARNLQLASAITVSKNELESYTNSGLLGLPDNTIISVDGKLFVFSNNIKRPASSFVIKQRGLNPANAIAVKNQDAKLFDDGPMLTPSEGTILRGQTNPAVYLVQNGELKLYTAATFTQYGAAGKVQIIPDAELETYPKKGFVPPKDGSLIKATNSQAVYLLEGGQKKPLSGELFRNRGFSFANLVILDPAEVDSYPLGMPPAPNNMTFFTNERTGEFYVYLNNGKHVISKFVAAQKRMTPDYKFDGAYVDSLTTSTPIIPKEGTIVKGDATADVYVVNLGVLKPLTYQAFVARRITPKMISVLPQAEVDGYVKGPVLTK